MNRSFVSALLSVACLAMLPAHAQTTGSAQADVILSVGGSPTASGVPLTGVVKPPMPATPTPVPHPGGKLTFFDGATVLNAGGTALAADAVYRSATFAQAFGTPDPGLDFDVNGGGLIGDFNGDGKNDLILYEAGLQVFLNTGEGGFRALPLQKLAFANKLASTRAAALDVDGDGKLDLLWGSSVAYGNGDGTFSRVAVLPMMATGFDQTYAIDVNGDGKPDIVAVNTPPENTDNPNNPTTVQLTFTVFRNDGSGNFTSLGTFPLAAPVQSGVGLCCVFFYVYGLSFADLNGDGKIDVISQTSMVPEVNGPTATQFNVMLNNGDGTFSANKPVDTSALRNLDPDGVAFGDLNGDGKRDLLLAFSDVEGANYLGAALGNGDGTFGAFSQLKLIDFLTASIPSPQVQAVDFNADGKLDAVLGSGELALGNGDGTFSLSTPLFAQPLNPQIPLNYPLLQADLFPNSWPSLVYLNLTSGANAVFTPQVSSSANPTVALSAGTHTLTAQYSGDSVYAAGVSSPVTISVAPAATTTTVTSSANPSYTGESVTFIATITSKIPSNPLAGSTATVSFSDASTVLGTAPVSGGSATFTTMFSSAGNHTITAAYGGDSNDAASSGTLTQTVDAPVAVEGGGGGSTSLTVASGQSVTTTVSVKGAAGFGGTVNFSCTGLPMNAACRFDPGSVTVSGAKVATTTLTVSTSALTEVSVRDGESSRAFRVLACGLPLLGLLTLLPVGRHGRAWGRRLLLCLGFALLVSMSGLTGCGNPSGDAKTAAGTYSFNVVATSGSATSTATYKLTVQ